MQQTTPIESLRADLHASGYKTEIQENWPQGLPGTNVLNIEQDKFVFNPIVDGSQESMDRVRFEILRRNWPWTPRQSTCLDCGAEAAQHPWTDTDRNNGPICKDCYERWKEGK